ncbi:CBS domain-containing protein [Candidatus Woesearchaeota archaeon]|nr:CBS domain-containing protein [Candidatus Woesearchaeota archaeon]
MEVTSIIKDDFVIIDDESSVTQMFGQLKNLEKRSGLVFRKNKYLGLIEKKKLLRSRVNLSEAKVKGYVQQTPLVSEHADIIETSYLMYQSNLDYLPVESNKKIIGVIQALDVAKLGALLPEAKHWKVNEVKLVKPTMLNKDKPIGEAISVMYDEALDQVPIFEKGKLYGILSYRDLFRKYLNWSPKRDVSAKFNKMASSRSAEVDFPHMASLPIENFSTNDKLLTTYTGASLKDALNMMEQNNVTCLPVLEGSNYKGLLTIKSILRKFASLKIPKNYNIRFVGLNKIRIEPYQKYALQKVASNEAFKLQRQIHNDFDLIIHIKAYDKEGPQQKFSVNMKIEYPGKIITSTQEDWDLITAVRKAFNNAKNETSSRLRDNKKKRERFPEELL